jgi:deoxyribonuclease IV
MPKAVKNINQPLIGCHVSIAGGLWKAPENALALNCETFQIFSRSPHGGPVPPITPEVVEKFQASMAAGNFKTFVIHAPYIINFGSANPRVYHGSISIIRQELERGSLIGANYVMFHPGSLKDNVEQGIAQIKEGFEQVMDGYKGSTQLLIEISAGAGQVVGDTFEEIAEIMAPIKKHPGFGGICFDTQHAFGSGYDLRTGTSLTKVFQQFDKIIGLKHLKMSHVNDSKVALASHRDRHEHIGEGLLGKEAFAELFKFLKAKKLAIPLILETEHDKVATDIKLLKTLRSKVY